MSNETIDSHLRALGVHLEPYLDGSGRLGEAGWNVTQSVHEGLLDMDAKARRVTLGYLHAQLEFVVEATPGGGSTWFARLLSALGKPAGHESVFRPTGVLRIEPLEEKRIVCDVSGFATHWLRLFPGILQYRLIRHPVGVVNSCSKHLGWEPERSWSYWVSVHREWAGSRRDTIRLEDPWRAAAALTGASAEYAEAVGMELNRNAHPGPDRVGWGDLPEEVRELARRYGYEECGYAPDEAHRRHGGEVDPRQGH